MAQQDADALNVAEVVVAGLVAPLEVPSTPRTGDAYGLIWPFPPRDMGLGGSEYSGELSTDSEMTDTQHEDFHKDSEGRRPEDVFALASVPLEEVAQEQAARAEHKKQARVAAGRPADDSAGDESSEDASKDDSSSEAESSEAQSSDSGSDGGIDEGSDEGSDEGNDEQPGGPMEDNNNAAKRQRTDDA